MATKKNERFSIPQLDLVLLERRVFVSHRKEFMASNDEDDLRWHWCIGA